MANITFDVATYNKASLALLMNSNPLVNLANKKFKNPQRVPGNIGMTIDFDEPPTVDFVPELAFGTFRDFTQKKVTLQVNKEYAVPLGVPELEYLFNLEQNGYMTPLSKAAIATISTKLGQDMAQEILDHTFMTFGDGTPNTISSYQQLDQAIENYIDTGNPVGDELVCVLPNTAVPQIIGNGLSQFAPMRNDEIANSWNIGEFAGVKFYKSNLLPTHIAGAVGVGGLALTVVSISADGTELTLSGASASDSGAIKEDDVLTFIDSPTMVRFLKWEGHTPSNQKVQVRATSDVASDGSGQVTVPIFPALVPAVPLVATSNVTTPIVAGMQLTVIPTHIAGLLYTEPSLFLAMPQMPDESPFDTANSIDMETGASVRLYYGSSFGKDSRGLVHDQFWGSTLIPEYAMRLAFVV